MSQKIPQFIVEKLDVNLHLQNNHPVEITKNLIYNFFDRRYSTNVQKFADLPKIVSVTDNFDSLLIPLDHPSRKQSDTYYVDADHVLRTHTTAHQNYLLERGERNFLIVGDVYRKDTVDKSHYYVFHQMEGVFQVPAGKDPRLFLQEMLLGLISHLFPGKENRILEEYFPFTENSFEIETQHQVAGDEKWLEILGGGVIHSKIMARIPNLQQEKLVAFGIGLERIAMIIFDIPDIRLFWSQDRKFLEQFSDGKITKFQPFSQLDPIVFDISFYVNNKIEIGNNEWKRVNDFYQIARQAGGDLIESVVLFDTFLHPKIGKFSMSFHIKFSPVSTWNDPALFFKEADLIMKHLRQDVSDNFEIELR